eukprot:CAMPEP_0170073968 /NCGR_PEP_ID=MMETSP0019_2-20121128/11324_1 /TAXON_ID=98059 /ORGANISM="Dinobryon sp., Strain UTEXLB2267" /LENGTH=210 /DNA_ID=CAMNT_0010283905 /DNA_START=682 /DNA_END=1314 /DNA_ORIENTATION=-
MTSKILKDKNFMVSGLNDEVGDDIAVVQQHLAVFLNDILVIANKIICDSEATSSSSTKVPQSKIKIERERNYRIDTTPLSSTVHQANSSGDVEGGSSDFSIVHDSFRYALALFETKKTPLNLIDLSEAEGKKTLTQGAYRMLGDIQRLKKLIGRVSNYSSLLTNGLTWLHLRMVENVGGMAWLHSPPISVVKKGVRGRMRVDEAGIDFVV